MRKVSMVHWGPKQLFLVLWKGTKPSTESALSSFFWELHRWDFYPITGHSNKTVRQQKRMYEWPHSIGANSDHATGAITVSNVTSLSLSVPWSISARNQSWEEAFQLLLSSFLPLSVSEEPAHCWPSSMLLCLHREGMIPQGMWMKQCWGVGRPSGTAV